MCIDFEHKLLHYLEQNLMDKNFLEKIPFVFLHMFQNYLIIMVYYQSKNDKFVYQIY